MASPRKPKKDRTSLVISAVIHILLVGGVVFWAYKTGKLEEIANKILQVVTDDKKKDVKKPEPIQQKQQPQTAKLPPINQGAQAPASSGTRRAVAGDAPAAQGGDSFFQDTRTQGEGHSTGSGGGMGTRPTNAPMPRVTAPPPARPAFAAAPKATLKQLNVERKKAAASIVSFGSDQISKTSVRDAGEIVGRVSGATVAEGKYAVIRGLTDRYSAATLNGAELPSADPYRRSAGLDLFPAKIIDRVTVTKTFTPDQPGSFTGGNISIVTKSFPEKGFVSLEVASAYNSQTTGNKDFLTTPGGSMTWLGKDDGNRDLNQVFWDPNIRIPTYRSALSRPISVNPTTATQRANLADAAKLNDLSQLAGPSPFAPTTKATPPTMNFVGTAGDTAFLFGRPVGVFVSVPYTHAYSSYAEGTVDRVVYNGLGSEQTVRTNSAYSEAKGTEVVNWAGTASLAYQLQPDHLLGYNFIYNTFTENSARIRDGEIYDQTGDVSIPDVEQNRLQYIERTLETQQFRGDHLFSSVGDLQFDWLATFTTTTQDEPNTSFYNTSGGQFNNSLNPQFPSRYWRELEEQNQNLKFDFLLPFYLRPALESNLKFGAFSSQADRTFRERILKFSDPNGTYAGNPNDFLTPTTLGANPIVTNGNFVTYNFNTFVRAPADFSYYTGTSDIPAAYAMLDLPVTESLRLIGGARMERTDIQVSAYTTVISEGVIPGTTNTVELQQDDLLPALGLVWTVKSNLYLRLNYGETIARPSFRELAPIRSYDPVLEEELVGNPRLQITDIKNYDVRLEWYPRPTELFSVGVFYKTLTNPIEKENISSTDSILTFVNRPEASVIGVEFEGRKSLDFMGHDFRYWTVGGNVSLIQSEESVSARDQGNHTRPDLLGKTRPLSDQSPYIINLDLTYDNPLWGTTLSLNYNIFGPRLLIANLSAPDIFEQPVPILDVVYSQRIGRQLNLKLAARNLLDPVIERTYGEDSEAIYSSYTRGRTYSISLTFDF